MKKTVLVPMLSVLLSVFSTVGINAQKANDQYGFGDRAFLIQSAVDSGKSANGFWDVPGKPGKTNGNLSDGRLVKKWLEMQVWQREKGDPNDRLFTFSPGQGGSAGKYSIKFARNRNWGVNYITGTGKIEARAGISFFEIKHIARDRWKIYVKPGYVICLDKGSTKNGSKLVVKPDHNGNDAIWVFYDLATLRSFIPASTAEKKVIKQTLTDALMSEYAMGQYFRHVDAQKFTSENSNSELQEWLNNLEVKDQWPAIYNIISAARDNTDTSAKRYILKAVAEATVKPGSGFIENTLKSAFQKKISQEAANEKDAASKKFIQQISGKF